MLYIPTIYDEVRTKINELNRSAIKIGDIMVVLENEAISGEPLTQAQIDSLKTRLKSEADNLKAIAGEIKTLVS